MDIKHFHFGLCKTSLFLLIFTLEDPLDVKNKYIWSDHLFAYCAWNNDFMHGVILKSFASNLVPRHCMCSYKHTLGIKSQKFKSCMKSRFHAKVSKLAYFCLHLFHMYWTSCLCIYSWKKHANQPYKCRFTQIALCTAKFYLTPGENIKLWIQAYH